MSDTNEIDYGDDDIKVTMTNDPAVNFANMQAAIDAAKPGQWVRLLGKDADVKWQPGIVMRSGAGVKWQPGNSGT